MKRVFITPCKGCLHAEFCEKVSVRLNSIIKQTDYYNLQKSCLKMRGIHLPQEYVRMIYITKIMKTILQTI